MFLKSSIKRLVDKFEHMGSFHDAEGGRWKNVVTPEKCAELKEYVEATPIMTFSESSWVDTHHNLPHITCVEVASVLYAGAARIKAIWRW